MNLDHIRKRLSGGFRPFVLVTSSGDSYPVPHPEFILVTPRSVTVADNEGFTTLLDPLHIVGIQEVPAKRNGNRKAKHRKSR